MEHASTETLSRPAARTVRAAPQPSPVVSDAALLAACRELDKQRQRVFASGKKAKPGFLDLLDTVRAATPETAAGAAARLALLEPPVPVLPLTGSNTDIDAAVERVREALATQTTLGRAHTRTEEALQQEQSTKLARAEAKANRAYIAAQEAAEAARDDLLALKPATLQEAQVKLHAFTMAVALNSVMPIWWREMSFDDARDVIWSNNYGVQEMAMGLETYAADVDRLTAPPTLPPASDWSEKLAAYETASVEAANRSDEVGRLIDLVDDATNWPAELLDADGQPLTEQEIMQNPAWSAEERVSRLAAYKERVKANWALADANGLEEADRLSQAAWAAKDEARFALVETPAPSLPAAAEKLRLWLDWAHCTDVGDDIDSPATFEKLLADKCVDGPWGPARIYQDLLRLAGQRPEPPAGGVAQESAPSVTAPHPYLPGSPREGSNARDTAAPRVRTKGGGALALHWAGIFGFTAAAYAVVVMALVL